MFQLKTSFSKPPPHASVYTSHLITIIIIVITEAMIIAHFSVFVHITLFSEISRTNEITHDMNCEN